MTYFETSLLLKKMLDHPNCVRLFEVIETPSHILAVEELCEFGSLFKYVRIKGPSSEHKVKFIFRQVLRGLAYIHSLGYALRRVTLDSILINNEGIVKFSNFGHAVPRTDR